MERGEDDKRDVEQSAEEHVVESVVERRTTLKSIRKGILSAGRSFGMDSSSSKRRDRHLTKCRLRGVLIQ